MIRLYFKYVSKMLVLTKTSQTVDQCKLILHWHISPPNVQVIAMVFQILVFEEQFCSSSLFSLHM